MREKQREETRRKLYHAALEVFARDGVAACRIEDIASKAEVSRAAFYFHFPSKEDVLLELLRDSEQPIADAISALPPDAPLQATFDLMTQMLTAYWTEGDRRKLGVEVFAVSLRRGTELQDREADVVRSVVSRRFLTAGERGELADMLAPEILADFYLLNCLAALSSWCVQPVLPLDAMLQGVVHLFMEGAGAPTPPPSAGKSKR